MDSSKNLTDQAKIAPRTVPLNSEILFDGKLKKIHKENAEAHSESIHLMSQIKTAYPNPMKLLTLSLPSTSKNQYTSAKHVSRTPEY